MKTRRGLTKPEAIEALIGRWQDRLDAATLRQDEDAHNEACRRIRSLKGLLAVARGIRIHRPGDEGDR